VEEDLRINIEPFRLGLSEGPRAAIVAHYYGRPHRNIAELAEVCRRQRVPLVEDCALALGEGGAGSPGEAAVYSFTKSNWCFGGGMLATNSARLLEKARTIALLQFVEDEALAISYGALSRADFEANRPSQAQQAAERGARLQDELKWKQENFYDAGRFDVRLTAMAAARAKEVLREIRHDALRCRKARERLGDALRDSSTLFFRAGEPAGHSPFFLLRCSGNAQDWVEHSARKGVTLRRCWPAYQPPEPAQQTRTIERLARTLLILEIHPQLSDVEMEHIAAVLRSLHRRAPGQTAV
jgi:dTDP-4-amino-4,6-dideoxygalactose transaminase